MSAPDEDYLLKDSKTFCMAPWIHLHTTPSGIAAPCCTATGIHNNGVGDSKKDSIARIINSDAMKSLRNDMLIGTKNPLCKTCYSHEEQGIRSFRQSFNTGYAQYLDDCLDSTRPDGTLDNFKMRYFDIRFNNICNFKCRTCNSNYSSQWEMEDNRNKRIKVIAKNNSKEIIQECISHIGYLECGIFCGRRTTNHRRTLYSSRGND